MGAIARRCYEKGAPAPLFTNVKDSPGFRALSAPMGESAIPGQRFARIALSVGRPSTSGAREIIDRIAAARRADLIEPVIIDSAPCMQNLRLGDDIDIMKLPIPMIHNHDGGRYLNTLGTIVCRTVDGTWTSWSIARIMALDARRATGIVMPFQHIGKVFATWRKARKDMPVAIAFGPEPIATYTSAMPLPELVSEVEMSCGRLVVTVNDALRDIESDAEKFCRRVGDIVCSAKVSDIIKTIVVVEDDIDPSNLRELIWAIDGRNSRSERGQLRIQKSVGWPMSPYTNPGLHAGAHRLGTRPARAELPSAPGRHAAEASRVCLQLPCRGPAASAPALGKRRAPCRPQDQGGPRERGV